MRCNEFARHKQCTVAPSRLKQEGIKCRSIRQYANEFIITFPKAYYSGFNYGISM